MVRNKSKTNGLGNHKKAQIETRVIVYLLAMFIAALILLYGFKVVRNMVGTQDEVLSVSFKDDFRAAVTKKSYEFRNVETLKFSLPNKYNKLCFVDLDNSGISMYGKIESEGYILIKNSIEDGVKRNVFLITQNRMKDGFYAGDLSLPESKDYFDCIDLFGGEANIRFEALGKDGVLVSGG